MENAQANEYECAKYAQVDGCDCVKNAYVFGMEESIKGAKLPLSVDPDTLNSNLTDGIKKLATSKSGEGHDQWLTGVTVQFDLTFSNKAWIEAERYRFLYFVSSQSTMHRITKYDLDSAYNEYVDERIIDIMKAKVAEYNMMLTNDDLPYISEEEKMRHYLGILYSNPCGFKLTARMTTNYRQLKTIYAQRRYHMLPEWREFCKWIETLPNSFLITGKEEIRS